MFSKILKAMLLLVSIPNAALAHDPICESPTVIGSTDLGYEASMFLIEGDYAYVNTVGESNKESGLLVVDISDPTVPIVLNHHVFNQEIFWLDPPLIHGDVLYVFSAYAMYVFDLSDPSDPVYTGAYENNFSTWIQSASIYGDTMYLGSHTMTGEVVDISTPLNPVRVDQDELYFSVITVVNGVGYTDYGRAVNLDDPHSPVEVGDSSAHERIYRTHVDQNILHLFGVDSLSSMDITDPLNPELVLDGLYLNTGPLVPFTVRGSILYLNGYSFSNTSLSAIDLSNPSNVLGIGQYSLDVNLEIVGLEYRDGIFWFLSNDSLIAYDLTHDPVVATRHTKAAANDVALFDDFAAVATLDGIEFFDISDPRDLVAISSVPLLDDARAVGVIDSMLYVANFREKLNLIDISDPTAPILVGNIDTGRRATDVAIAGDLLYVVDRFDGVTVLDITDPTNPIFLSIADTPGWAKSITVDMERQVAYVSHNRFDLQIFDISNPLNLLNIGSITPVVNLPDGTDTRGIESTAILGNLLYTAEATEGFRVFDVSNPSSPVEINHLPTQSNPELTDGISYSGYTHQIVIEGDQMFVPNGSGGIAAYDISDPVNPVQTQWLINGQSSSSISSSRSAVFRDGLVFSTVFEGGLRAYNFSDCVNCVADINEDDSLNFLDVSAFLMAFVNQGSSADINDDSSFNFLDVSDFLASFSVGCP